MKKLISLSLAALTLCTVFMFLTGCRKESPENPDTSTVTFNNLNPEKHDLKDKTTTEKKDKEIISESVKPTKKDGHAPETTKKTGNLVENTTKKPVENKTNNPSQPVTEGKTQHAKPKPHTTESGTKAPSSKPHTTSPVTKPHTTKPHTTEEATKPHTAKPSEATTKAAVTQKPYSCGTPKHFCDSKEAHAFIMSLEKEGCSICGSHSCKSFYSVDEWGNSCLDMTRCPSYSEKKDPVNYCSVCFKKTGTGDNGTCVRFTVDSTCPECGKEVKAKTCHSH